ncbi:MAG: hypothetical protein HFG89_03885 [Dorea sp.]|jgi:ribonuclease HIII|nr:hypothetical protein [Dorea sp.]
MENKTKDNYSFIPIDKAKTLTWIEEKYGEYKVSSNENNVENYYKFNNGDFIKTYKDTCEKGKKSRNGKILMCGRNADYHEFREKDMRLNNTPVEESDVSSPLISDLNFNHKVIGSDETGKGETFKYLIITAAYVNGADDVKRYIKSGVDDSKEILKAIPKIGEELTHIHNWDELLENLDEKKLFITDCSVTKIITNEEYNERCYKNGENVNDVIKEAHLEVIREVYKRHPGSEIVVDDFYDKNEKFIDQFKKELSSNNSPTDPGRVFMTVKADSKIMAVSLASVISSYICTLGCDYVQNILNNIYKKESEGEIPLPKGNPGLDNLSNFFSKLKPERKDEFIDKYSKKIFKNVQQVLNK